jgi:flagellar biosynthesis component FlhA
VEGKEAMIDLDIIRSKSREIGQIVVLDASEKTSNASLLSVLPWIGFPVLFLLALWLGIQIQKRKNTAAQSSLNSDTESEGEQESEEENAEILQRLLRHNGKKLNTEEFDAVLGIHEITNFDSKRIKRSRLIKSINKQHEEKNGFPLITRIKSSEDKRFIFNKITFENGN